MADGKYKSEADIKDKDLKELFGLRNQDGKFDMKDLEAATEKQRQALVDAIKAAFVPVTHVIKITAEE